MNKEELKALRLRLNLTREAMAEKLGITASAVYKIESGENQMRKSVAMLCQQLANHHLIVENP